MRDILTALAIGAILLLAGGLVAPHLVDWDSRRDEIARHLSQLVGLPVTVRGPIAIELLPAPYLRLTHVSVGGSDARMSAEIGRLRLRAAIPPLLRGELRITDAALQSPTIVLRADAAVAQAVETLPPLSDVAGRIGLDRLRISNGRLAVRTEGGHQELARGIDGSVEMASLIGPIRGNLSYMDGSERRVLRMSIGRFDGERTRVRALVESEASATRFDLDGELTLRDAAGRAAASFDGQVQVNGVATLGQGERQRTIPWRIAARALLDSDAARLDSFETILGEAGRSVAFGGTALLSLNGTPRLDATISARQIDLDKLMADGARERASSSPLEIAGMMPRLAPDGGAALPIDGRIDISIGSVLVNGEVITAPRLIMSIADGVPTVERLEGAFPGTTELLASGRPGTGETLFDGHVRLSSKDIPRLLSWASGGLWRGASFREADVAGALVLTRREIGVSDAKIRFDRSDLTGRMALRFPSETANGRATLALDLTAEQLDIASLPRFVDIEMPLDVVTRFEAKRVHFADLGAGRIVARLRQNASVLSVDELTVDDLGGASFAASGAIGPNGGKFEARLEASRLDALAELMARVLPGGLTSWLAKRTPVYAPASMRIVVDSEGMARSGLRHFQFAGTLGQSRVYGDARFTDDWRLVAGGGLTFTLDAPQSTQLLRQVGIDVPQGVELPQPGRVTVALGGPQGSVEAELAIDADIGTARIALNGRQEATSGRPLRGRLTVGAIDAGPLGQALGIHQTFLMRPLPFRLSSDVTLANAKLTLGRLDAAFGTVPLTGELAFNFLEFGRISGQLRTTVLDVAPFLPIVFGALERWPAPGVWPEQAFAAAVTPPLPGDVWIEAERLVHSGAPLADKARMVFRFERGLIFLDHVAAEIAGGSVVGQATLRRIGPQVSLTTDLALDRVAIGNTPLTGRLQGRASGTLDVNAFGTSFATLLGSVAGGGRLDLRDLVLPSLDRQALVRLLSRPLPDTGSFDAAALARDFAAEVARGRTTLGAIDVAVSAAAGQVRVGAVEIGSQAAPVSLFAQADLKRWQATGRALYSVRDPPKGWTGRALPEALAIFSVGPGGVTSSVDVASLASGLTAVMIARDLDRIEAMEQDGRERQFFLRRLRASEAERRREEAEAARREEAEAARRAEEERKKQDEQRRIAEQRRAEELRRQEEQRQRERAPAVAPVFGAPIDLRPPAAQN